MANNSILDIKEILNEYSLDIQEITSETADKYAKLVKQDLTNTSPVRTGKFKKGWRIYKSKGKYEDTNIVYNTNAGLTQLLEKPHSTRNGRTITPKSAGFMAKVESRRINEYERELERIIQNGGK